MLTSTRRGIVYPNTTRTDSADVPRDFSSVVAALEVDVVYGQGTFAARPISTGGSPGLIGRVYYGTDTGHLYWDFGTGWTDIGPSTSGTADGSITGGPAGAGVKIAAATITHDNIASGTITSTEIANGTIVVADISSTLIPSSGAGAGTEALRALGTAAGTAAAGTHASQHSRTGADPLVISTFISSGTFASRPSSSLVSGQVYTATDTGGGTSYMYNGAAWITLAAAVTHAAAHLAGGADAIAWTTVLGQGTAASRPAAASSNAGYIWFATDTLVISKSDGAAWTSYNTWGGTVQVKSNGMVVHRTPYNNDRHIEAGIAAIDASVTFTDAYNASPVLTYASTGSGGAPSVSSVSTTGFVSSHFNSPAYSGNTHWHAEGAD